MAQEPVPQRRRRALLRARIAPVRSEIIWQEAGLCVPTAKAEFVSGRGRVVAWLRASVVAQEAIVNVSALAHATAA